MQPSFFRLVSSVTCLWVSVTAASPLPLDSCPSVVTNYGYQGCYTEGTNVRALSGKSVYDDGMTVEKCATACIAFSMFGIEYGRECYCGDALNIGSTSAPEGECSFQCPGDATELCGAGNRLNVYSKMAPTITSDLPTSAPSSSPTSTPSSASYSALGCYTEATQGRALAALMYGDDALTVELCAKKCAGYSMFGVEYYRECYCGNELMAGSAPAPSTDCSFPCAGDKLETCGGGSRLNVYQVIGSTTSSIPVSVTSTTTSAAVPTATGYKSEGCYTEATGQRALTGKVVYDDGLTVEICAAACKGYAWFGMEYGRECYCGNLPNAGSVLTGPESCSFPCPGNSLEKCGAGDLLNMYTYGYSPVSSAVVTSSSITQSSTSFSDISTSSVEPTTSQSSTVSSETVTSSLDSSTSSSATSTSDTPTTSEPPLPTITPITCDGSLANAIISAGALGNTYCSSLLSVGPGSTQSSTVFSTFTITSSTTQTVVATTTAISPAKRQDDTFSFTSTYSPDQLSSACSCLSIQPISSTVSITAVTTQTAVITFTTVTTQTSTSSVAPVPTNVFANGGFEAADGRAAGWATNNVQNTNYGYNFEYQGTSSNPTHSGSQMLEIRVSAPNTLAQVFQVFPAKPSTTYSFSIWTKTPVNGQQSSWQMFLYTGDYRVSGGTSNVLSFNGPTYANSNPGSWYQTTRSYTTAAGASQISFQIRASRTNIDEVPRYFYVDDVSLIANA